jgi:hypothetical protein
MAHLRHCVALLWVHRHCLRSGRHQSSFIVNTCWRWEERSLQERTVRAPVLLLTSAPQVPQTKMDTMLTELGLLVEQ